MNLTISCNALAGITTPQTIKIEDYINFETGTDIVTRFVEITKK